MKAWLIPLFSLGVKFSRNGRGAVLLVGCTLLCFPYAVLSELGRNLILGICFSILECMVSFYASTYRSINTAGLRRYFTYDVLYIFPSCRICGRKEGWLHKTQDKMTLGSCNIIQKLFPYLSQKSPYISVELQPNYCCLYFYALLLKKHNKLTVKLLPNSYQINSNWG